MHSPERDLSTGYYVPRALSQYQTAHTGTTRFGDLSTGQATPVPDSAYHARSLHTVSQYRASRARVPVLLYERLHHSARVFSREPGSSLPDVSTGLLAASP
eukprot:2345590-Rhodomonas_salina.1